MENNKTKVIFFDGVCGLCNGFVDFVFSIDKKKQFLFSPLQSDYAKGELPENLTKDLSTIVVKVDQKIYTKSLAVLKVLTEIGGIWNIARVVIILPKVVLNFFYDLIATNRYKLFGKNATCRIPSADERQRFLN